MSSEETTREPHRANRPGAMTMAMQAVHAQRTGPKVLRIAVLQGGRIVEDRTFGQGETVTAGRSEKNHFVVQGEGVPARHELFRRVGNDYVLNATDAMSGRVVWSGGAADLDQMREGGGAHQAGGPWPIKLSDTSRGKVVIASITLLFQFVLAPSVPVRPRLPAAARAGFARSIDWLFTAFVVFTFTTMFGAIVCLENADWPLEAELAAVPEYVAVPIFDERIPPPEQTEKVQTPAEAEPEWPEAPAEQRSSAPEQRDVRPDRQAESRPLAENPARIAERAAQTAQALIVGALGSAMDGAIVDVLAGGAVPGSASDVLSLASGVGPATVASDPLRERNVVVPGGGQRDLGALAARGGPKATAAQGEGGKVAEKPIRGRIELEPGEDIAGSGDFDASIVVQRIKAQLSAIRACYERVLKHDPTLAGKVTIEFTIEERGTVSGVKVTGNTTGSPSVGTCVSNVFQSLRFTPGPEGGSVTFSYPFVFAPQG